MRQYFSSVIGYIFLSFFLLVSGYYFTTGNLLAQSSDMRMFFLNIMSLLMFLVPVITMRMFAEERKLKTEQLLLTSPLSLLDVVLGKYLATMTLLLAGLAGTLLFPVILMVFGAFDPWFTLGNYIGIILVSGSFVAIGMFVSVLTANQVVAATVTYMVLLGLWMMGLAGSVFQNGNIAGAIQQLSLFERYGEFALGVFSPASILYYLSISALFIFLTVRAIGHRQQWN